MAFSEETITYAKMRGMDPADLPLVCNGCSGGISPLYAIAGRGISCVECCNRHDIDYALGGSGADRKAADTRLLACALEKAGKNGWKRFRAYVMYGVVRACGGVWPGAWAG